MRHDAMLARKCQFSSNSSHAFFQFSWLKGVVAWLENHTTTSLKSCGANNVHATTSLFPKLLAWKELRCRHYPRHNVLKKLWRGFLVTPQLLSVSWIGRRPETNWKKTGAYGPSYVASKTTQKSNQFWFLRHATHVNARWRPVCEWAFTRWLIIADGAQDHAASVGWPVPLWYALSVGSRK